MVFTVLIHIVLCPFSHISLSNATSFYVLVQDVSLWEFEQDGGLFQIRVDGNLIFNDGDLILAAALAGQGLGYLLEDQITAHVAEGRLIQVLPEWCPTSSGYYLYHPNRRQTPSALAALVDALRV